MKFKTGDTFKVVRDSGMGSIGYIRGSSWNAGTQKWEYIVKWDAFSQESTYNVDDADDLWELHETMYKSDVVLAEVVEEKCTPYNHSWKVYDSGFRSFEYCSKCNEERK